MAHVRVTNPATKVATMFYYNGWIEASAADKAVLVDLKAASGEGAAEAGKKMDYK